MCYQHCFVFSSHKNAFSLCKKLKGLMLFRENSLLQASTRKRQSFTRSPVFLETLLRVLRKMRDFLGRQVAYWYLALHKFAHIEQIFPLLLGKFDHRVQRGFILSTKWRGSSNVWSFLLRSRVEIDKHYLITWTRTSNWLNALFLVVQSSKGLAQSESEELFTRELESKSAVGSKKTFSMASKEVWNIGLLD